MLPIDQLVPLPVVGKQQEVVVCELHARTWAHYSERWPAACRFVRCENIEESHGCVLLSTQIRHPLGRATLAESAYSDVRPPLADACRLFEGVGELQQVHVVLVAPD